MSLWSTSSSRPRPSAGVSCWKTVLDRGLLGNELSCFAEILECLHMVSLVDINDFGCEKLVSSAERHYREQMHILNDMVRLLKLHQAEQFIPIRSGKSPNCYDENLAFEFNNLAMQQQPEATAAASSHQFRDDETTLMRKIAVLDDPGFLGDFRRLLQLGALSLLPPEHSRVIRLINENTEYLRELSLSKSTRRDEMLNCVDAKLAAIHLNPGAAPGASTAVGIVSGE